MKMEPVNRNKAQQKAVGNLDFVEKRIRYLCSDEIPVIQRALIRKALAPNLILEFAGGTQFRMKGRGRYRMAADVEDAVISCRNELGE